MLLKYVIIDWTWMSRFLPVQCTIQKKGCVGIVKNFSLDTQLSVIPKCPANIIVKIMHLFWWTRFGWMKDYCFGQLRVCLSQDVNSCPPAGSWTMPAPSFLWWKDESRAKAVLTNNAWEALAYARWHETNIDRFWLVKIDGTFRLSKNPLTHCSITRTFVACWLLSNCNRIFVSRISIQLS